MGLLDDFSDYIIPVDANGNSITSNNSYDFDHYALNDETLDYERELNSYAVLYGSFDLERASDTLRDISNMTSISAVGLTVLALNNPLIAIAVAAIVVGVADVTTGLILDVIGRMEIFCALSGYDMNGIPLTYDERIDLINRGTADIDIGGTNALISTGVVAGYAYETIATIDLANKGGNNILSGKWVNVNESMSDASRLYQKQITGKEGQAFLQNGVKFDGVNNGILVEVKGSYNNFVNKNTGEFYDWFEGKDSLIDQANGQIAASEGTQINWYFSDQISMNATKDLFQSQGIKGINYIFESLK